MILDLYYSYCKGNLGWDLEGVFKVELIGFFDRLDVCGKLKKGKS